MPYTENVGFKQGLFGSLLNQAVRPTRPGGPKGLFGLDPATWAQISGAFGNAAISGGNMGTAMTGVGHALQNRQLMEAQRQQQEYQTQTEEWRKQMQQRQQEFEERQAQIRNQFLEQSAGIDERGQALREAEFARGPNTARWRTLSPEESARLGLPAGTVSQINDTTGQINPVTETRAQTWTQGQRDKSIYVSNMVNGFNRAMEIVQRGFDPRGVVAGRPRWTMSPEGRDFYRALRDYAEGELRAETGAAATKDEIDRKLEQLMAGINESDSNVAAIFARMRDRIEGMAQGTGGAFESLYPEAGAAELPERYRSVLAGQSTAQPQGSADTPRFNTEAEVDAAIDAMAPGTRFIGPDGQTYVKR